MVACCIKARPQPRDSASVMERQVRCRLPLAVVAAFIGSSSAPALAQAPGIAPALSPASISKRAGGIAGTGFGTPAGIQPRSIPLLTGRGHIGAGTGGIGGGVGNATGGINGTTRAGTGGVGDTTGWGLATGGINGTGRGLSAATGGIRDSGGAFGRNTGGIIGSSIGAGTGGIGDLNSLGAVTGGIREGNAPRFQFVQ